MENCTGYDKAYLVDYSGGNFNGDTPQEACAKNGVAYGNNYSAILPNGRCEVGYSGSGDSHAILHVCIGPSDVPTPLETPASSPGTAITCAGTCTVQIELKPAQPDADRIQDIALVSGLFLGAAIIIVCMRGILRLFESSPHGEN